jgi:hypothetical protein
MRDDDPSLDEYVERSPKGNVGRGSRGGGLGRPKCEPRLAARGGQLRAARRSTRYVEENCDG